MMSPEIIGSFVRLGKEIKAFLVGDLLGNLAVELQGNIQKAFHENGWFTEDNIKLSLQGFSVWLTEEKLRDFVSRYGEAKKPKRIGLILAGNIPMVGFHDVMCVLLSGHIAVIKMSSSDKVLIPVLLRYLIKSEPLLAQKVEYVERLNSVDAVIATGSNNSARYFEYYFRDIPHIIRKNRNSLAVLSGNESAEKLREFGLDIFSFFGLGCRNVSKVFLPEGFDLNLLFGALTTYSDVAMNNKYVNNYTYYKVFYMMNKASLLENGFLLMKEDISLFSPVSMLFYQFYKTPDDVKKYLNEQSENIQCVVSDHPDFPESVPIGKSQFPDINDYADSVDTMRFLVKL